MASTYTRDESPFIWLKYKSEDGRWKAKKTGYRKDNLGDRKQAERLAHRQSEAEAARAPLDGAKLQEWVLGWIISTYGTKDTTTPGVYKRMWRTIEKFLATYQITTAAQLNRRENVQKYLVWRTTTANTNRGLPASRNMAIQEIKFIGTVLKEAINLKQCTDNAFSKPGLRKDKSPGKVVWSADDMKKAAAHFEREKSRWMRCALYFGIYQACRLRQCQLPIASIRFDLGVIQYPDHLVKGREGYTQPIDPRFMPILKELVKEAKRAGEKTICTVPWDASIRMRRSLDRAGLPGLVHHGLRATWITLAAENGIPESQAMAFCHHESAEVHRIYKKLSSVGIAHIPALMRLPAL